MRDLSAIDRTIRGTPIATLAELQTYAYEVPEDKAPPALFSRLTAGEEVEPGELFTSLDTEGRVAAGDSDAALEIIETIKRRLRAAFPDEVPDTDVWGLDSRR
ncbi:MAG TPA: hypothetical protein VF225_08250 [Gaiellaceae bacterium]